MSSGTAKYTFLCMFIIKGETFVFARMYIFRDAVWLGGYIMPSVYVQHEQYICTYGTTLPPPPMSLCTPYYRAYLLKIFCGIMCLSKDEFFLKMSLTSDKGHC